MAQTYQAKFAQEGKSIDYTPGSAVAGGSVVVQGSLVGFAKLAIAANKLGALAIAGVFDLVKINGAIAAGAPVYWDADGNPQGGVAGSGAATTTNTDAGDTFVGFAIAAAAETAEVVQVAARSAAPEGFDLTNVIADPGNAGAIPVAGSGSCALVTAEAETRALAIPTAKGQMLSLSFKTDVGDCVVTAASAVNQTGNNTLTFADAGDMLMLVAIENGAALAWRVVANDGVALTTV